MAAEEIRAEYVETIARAFYQAEAADEKSVGGYACPPWEALDEAGKWRVVHDARLAVDALAAAGLLPIQHHRPTRITRPPRPSPAEPEPSRSWVSVIADIRGRWQR